MKDLKAFMAKVADDSKLAEQVGSAASAEEVVAIAADAGYKFTADELMDERMSQVAGGGFFDNIWNSGKETVKEMGKEMATNVVNAAVGAVVDTATGYMNQAGQKVQTLGSQMSNF